VRSSLYVPWCIALNIGAKRSGLIKVGERLVIETPGGGGYGVGA